MGLKNVVCPPRNITAKAYIIYRTGREGGMGKVVLSENSKNRQEMASLTKIMTAILAIEICKRFSIDKYAEEVRVS